MSLKEKVQALINIASKGKMFVKWSLGEPYDLVIKPEYTFGFNDSNFFDNFIPSGFEKTVDDPTGFCVTASNVSLALSSWNNKDMAYTKNPVLTSVNLPAFIIPNNSRAKYMFAGQTALKYVKLGGSKYSLAWTFEGSTALEVVEFETEINQNISLYWSENLTQECLISLIENLSTNNTLKTFWVGDVNAAKIPEEYKQMLKNKKWTLK